MTLNEHSRSKTFAMFLFAAVLVCLVPLIPIAPRYDTFMHPFRAEIAASICLFILCSWMVLRNRKIFSNNKFFSPELTYIVLSFTLFILWSVSSLMWATSWRSVAHHSGIWVCYLAVFLFARYFINTKERLDQLSKALVVLTILICASPVIEYYSLLVTGGMPDITLRYSRYNELLLTIFPLLFVFALKQSGRWSYVGTAALALIAILVFATARRAGMGIIVLEVVACTTLFLFIKELRPYRARTLKTTVVIVASVMFFQALTLLFTTATPATARYNDPFLAGSDGLRRVVGTVALNMGSEHPMKGVGAGNYGQVYASYPVSENVLDNDPSAAIVLEERIAERAHNEYLQIFAELGSIGIGLFVLLMIAIGSQLKRNITSSSELSSYAAAALIGMVGFLLSSLVSSYSFRLVQNGSIFFLVAAIGTTVFSKNEIDREQKPPRLFAKLITVMILIGCVSLLTLSVSRIYAVHTAISGEGLTETGDQAAMISRAISLDLDNASLATFYAAILKSDKNYSDSAVQYQRAISLGRITAVDYFNLSSVYYLDGHTNQAIDAIKAGLVQHPRSVFLLTRLALLLEERGDKVDADTLLAKAREVNANHAIVWQNYLRHGGRMASIHAHENKLPAIMDLYPHSAVLAVKAEREIRFPEDKFEMPKQEAAEK